MPTVGEHLAAARANYAAQLAELSDPARRKVSYSLGGRSVSWTEYQKFLLDALAQLDELAAAEGPPVSLVTAIE